MVSGQKQLYGNSNPYCRGFIAKCFVDTNEENGIPKNVFVILHCQVIEVEMGCG